MKLDIANDPLFEMLSKEDKGVHKWLNGMRNLFFFFCLDGDVFLIEMMQHTLKKTLFRHHNTNKKPLVFLFMCHVRPQKKC